MAIVFDAARRAVFLEKLTDTLNVSGSARAAGVSRETAYDHRAKDPEFKKAWDDALEEGLDLAEQSCNMRAFKGVVRPVLYKGEPAGQWVNAKGEPAVHANAHHFVPIEIREYSDTLAQFMLKAHRPEKFRDRLEVTGELKVTERILAARKRVGG